MNNAETFSEILVGLMLERNLNQSECAKLIGIKQSQISEWLHEKSKPGYDNLKQICQTLGISSDTLLGLD